MSDDTTISIAGLDKAEVPAALYNRAKPQGMGCAKFIPGDMTADQAREFVARGHGDRPTVTSGGYFDYLNGRVMKVDLSGDTFDPFFYDYNNGQGAANEVIAKLRLRESATS